MAAATHNSDAWLRVRTTNVLPRLSPAPEANLLQFRTAVSDIINDYPDHSRATIYMTMIKDIVDCKASGTSHVYASNSPSDIHDIDPDLSNPSTEDEPDVTNNVPTTPARRGGISNTAGDFPAQSPAQAYLNSPAAAKYKRTGVASLSGGSPVTPKKLRPFNAQSTQSSKGGTGTGINKSSPRKRMMEEMVGEDDNSAGQAESMSSYLDEIVLGTPKSEKKRRPIGK